MQKALMWALSKRTWGWAIIVMSLVVNFVILPIYMKAESWQEEERAIRQNPRGQRGDDQGDIRRGKSALR